mgnify:CR=1 FL=1
MNEDFEIYDRITDKIMYINSTISLDFVTALSYKSKDGSRRFFHSEYEKTSQYIGTQKSRTITRNVKFFFVINDREEMGGGIILRPSDVIILCKILDSQVFPWFHGQTRVFDIIDKRLVVKGKYKPVLYVQSEYRYLSFVPIVYEFQSGQYKEGVHVCMNTQDTYFDMTIDDLYNFYYILTNTSMYNLAAEMMNYVKSPPYGVNKSELRGLGSGGNGFVQNNSQQIKHTDYRKPTGADFLNSK